VSTPIAAGVTVLATMAGDSGRKTVVVAEPGSTMLDGGTAAGKRVFLYLYDVTWLQTTDAGRKIFDNAVAWCLGPVTADFTADYTAGAAPLTVRFSDRSTGPATAWNWSFGDGQTGTARNPTHTYAQPGTYTVSLTATGPGQTSTQTRTGYIVVGPRAPADLDGDGDVDSGDQALLQSCSSGPSIPHSGTVLCEAADSDHDNDVDQSDFGIYQACVSGTNVPASPDCVP
jgi:PKD repeat protein